MIKNQHTTPTGPVLKRSAVAVALVLATGAHADPGPNSVTIPSTGQELSIQITAPADGADVIVPPGTVLIEGQASVGALVGTPTNLLFAVDVSGSTSTIRDLDCNGDSLLNSDDDLNGAGFVGDILDCEIQGLLSLQQSLSGAVNVNTGLIAFGRTAAVTDIDPTGAFASLSPLGADNGGAIGSDLEEVARSLRNRNGSGVQFGANLFTPVNVVNGTDFATPLQEMLNVFQTMPGERNIGYMLSDGQHLGPTNPNVVQTLANQLSAAGVQVNTYSLGPDGAGCDPNNPDIRRALLARIANTTGGTCTEVQDPSDIDATLAGSFPAGLAGVEVDGNPVSVNALGDFSYLYTCPGSRTTPNVVATAFADDADSGPQTTVSADVTLNCIPDNEPPVANAGPDQSLECSAPGGADATLNGSASSDPDGDPLTYDWSSSVFGTASGETVTEFFPLGSTQVDLIVTDDDGESDSDSMFVTVSDTTAPDLSAPGDVAFECTSPAGTSGDIGTASVADVCDTSPSLSNDAPAAFPLGDTIVTWGSSDASSNSASATQVVSVIDTTAPSVSASVSPEALWPPNHKMVDISVSATATDVCDVAVSCRIDSVSSNELVNGTGEGNTAPDWVIDGALGLKLRAERDGGGSGRIYTINLVCEDGAGNSSSESLTVNVPKSKGKKK